MIGVLTVLIVCITCINVSKAGILCSERNMTWQEEIDNCTSTTGTPVTINAGNEDYIKQHINESFEVWASGSWFFEKCDNGFDVCAYSYIDGYPPYLNNEDLYGDCNVEINYICRRNGPLSVYLGNYYEAILCKIDSPTPDQVISLALKQPGYYWRPITFKLCNHTYRYFSPDQPNPPPYCKVYNKLHGFFYVDCRSARYAICDFHGDFKAPGYTECLTDHLTSTIVPSSSTVTEKVTTSQPTSTIKLPPSDVTTTRQSYVSTRTTTEYNHISDLTTPSTYSTISYKTSTPGTSDTNSNVNGIISTPTSPYTQEQQGNNQAEETNLGLIVGLPVALCAVILGVTVMVVYVWRRRQRHSRDNKGGKYVDGNVRSFTKTNHLQTNKNVTVSNETYNNDVYDDTEQDDYASIGENDIVETGERSRNFITENNTFDNEYSFSQFSDMNDRGDQYDTTTNIKHHQIKTSNTYDRVHIDNTVDEYDDNEDDQYDTTTTHQRCTHQNSSDEYNHVNIKRADGMDLYDTTRSKQPINQTTDNIYNKLDSVDGDKDNIYDKTSSQQQHQRLQVNDDTYNTFN